MNFIIAFYYCSKRILGSNGAFTLSWVISMGTFTTSFFKVYLVFVGFGGPEKDREFVLWLWRFYSGAGASVDGPASPSVF